MTYLMDCIPDDNGTLMGVCAAFPEVNTFGANVSHVHLNIRGAIEEAIAARMAAGRDIPAGATRTAIEATGDRDDGSTRLCVKLDARTVAVINLYRMLRNDEQEQAGPGSHLN